MRNSGYSLIELLVSIALFALLSAMLAHGMVFAWTMQRQAASGTRAIEIAAREMERLRLGGESGSFTEGDFFIERAILEQSGTHHLCVDITWNDGKKRQYSLESSVRIHR